MRSITERKYSQLNWFTLSTQQDPFSLNCVVNFSDSTEVKTSFRDCKFSGNCLNSGFHEAQIPALLFIFRPFWRLLAQIHALFQAFSLRSAYMLHPWSSASGFFSLNFWGDSKFLILVSPRRRGRSRRGSCEKNPTEAKTADLMQN